jgi:hypothetical protein
VHPALIEHATHQEAVIVYDLGTWERRSFSKSVGRAVRILDALYANGEFVVAGFTDRGLAIWYSSDALTWIEASMKGVALVGEEPGVQVAYGPKGWIALVSQPGRAWSIRSDDGRDWNAPAPIPGDLSATDGLAGNLEGYLAVGGTVLLGAELSEGQALAWFSQDGFSWTRVLESERRTGMTFATGDHSTFLATGFDAAAPAVWTTKDGSKWVKTKGCAGQADQTALAELRSAVKTSNGWIAVGLGGSAMLSVDGNSWRQLQLRSDEGGSSPDAEDLLGVGHQLLFVSRGAIDSINHLDLHSNTVKRLYPLPHYGSPEE